MFVKDSFDFASKTVNHGWLSYNDKLGHFAGFYFLARVLYAVLPWEWWIIAICLLWFGLLWELFELWAGMDEVSWRDIICDAAGILLALA